MKSIASIETDVVDSLLKLLEQEAIPVQAQTTTQEIFLCIFSLIVWAFLSLIFMIIWEIKAGISMPATTKTVSVFEYNILADQLKNMAFHIIPRIASGYFVIGMLILDLILKTKPTKEDKQPARTPIN